MHSLKRLPQFGKGAQKLATRALLGTGLAIGLQSLFLSSQEEAYCCGIVGYLGEKRRAFDVLRNGIKILENRGYDSCGVVTLRGGEAQVTKFATTPRDGDCIDRLLKGAEYEEKHKEAGVGIGHTRWATCGSKDDKNAHPHWDQDKSVFVVHNGTILNYRHLKDNLISQGVKFANETDSEVIAQLIGVEYKKCKDPKESIKLALEQLEGTYGLLILFTDLPDRLFCIEHGSHLVVGMGDNEIFIGSEARAFQDYTLMRMELNDNQLIEMGKNPKGEYAVLNTQSNFSTPNIMKHSGESIVDKGKYTTFFEKEINEQDEACFNAIGKNSRIDTINYSGKFQGLEQYREELKEIQHLYIFGCGTSHISASIASHFFKMINNFQSVQVYDPSDFADYEMPKSEKTLGIFISQSGETRDVIQVQEAFKKKGFMTMGVVNVIGSKLSKDTDFGCYVHAGYEQSVPSTKTFLASTIVQIVSALWFSFHRGKLSFINLRKEICLSVLSFNTFIRNLLDSPQMQTSVTALAELLKNEVDMLCVGKGLGLQAAREAALKLKEVCYIHAEAIGSGDLKHGPISLIDSSKPRKSKVLLFIFEDSRFDEMCLSLDQVRAREAYTIVITDCYEKLDKAKIDFALEVQNVNHLTVLLSIIPVQLLCLRIAQLKGINPDKPRNLAKTVTVN